jgi:alpha-D-ribose 1-methylphosphonate 5-triphosphate synthase subunit PhnI
LSRRISAAFKDVPGGQLLGPTYDYTQRLLDFALLADEGGDTAASVTQVNEKDFPISRLLLLRQPLTE